jgi:beta-lactamase regulating signal transducer with metallopeptidase domain
MDWMSNLFIVLLLTDITGTLFYLISLLFRGKKLAYHAGFLRFLVAATLFAYTVPFIYAALYASRRIDVFGRMNSNVNLFYNTLTTKYLFALLGFVWIVMFLLLLAYRLYRRMQLNFMCRGNIPEEDASVEQCFLDVCKTLGIEGRVELCRNDLVRVPCTTYYHGAVVILPLEHYTRQDAAVVFYHELCHYIRKDIFLKTWGVLVSQLHVFNPAVHILLKQMNLICEMGCDRMACEKGKGFFNTREYFETIDRMILTDEKEDWYQLFSLVDSRSNYERRIINMKQYQKHGSLKKGTALLLSACFLLGSSMTAFAAGDGLAEAYRGLTAETIDRAEDVDTDTLDAEALEELCRAYDLDPDTVTIMDDGMATYGRRINITWLVPAGETYLTSGMTESNGEEVAIAVSALPTDVTYQTGLKDPTETLRYVQGEGSLAHTFEIEQSGRYYFFVTNMSETEDLDIVALITR